MLSEERGKVRSKTLIMLISLLLMATITVTPVLAWVDSTSPGPEPTDDGNWEAFGPRADKLLIKLYASDWSEWTGLENGEIDITDWPLDQEHYNKYLSPPYNESILVTFYGPEFGLFILDVNNNNNPYLGNPPDPEYPNPVYPNPCGVKEFRQAISLIVDQDHIVRSFIGEGFAYPLYQPVGPEFGGYQHPEIRPGGALEDLCYLYNPTKANELLNASGFPINPETGWRFWDRNGNGIEDADEYLELKFFIRSDHKHREDAGLWIAQQIETELKVRVNEVLGTISAARDQVMANKDFHLYTGGWSLGVDPDFLILWNWDFYWHPGRPYNYAGCHNATYDEASYGIMFANTEEEARENAWLCQIVFCQEAFSVPLWSYAASKANARRYTGGTGGAPVSPDDGENKYRGQTWEGIVNIPGYGTDNGFSFLNMHPQGYEFGDGSMTIRYAFKTQDIRQLNPVYAEWLWDNTVLDLIGYESLLTRNPYDLSQFIPWVAEAYKVDTYEHPIYGTCSRITFTIRDDVFWQDGTPVTVADIYFTFVEIDDILESRGLPPPWWISNVENILSFTILDPYNFEVLLDVKSVFAVGWIGGNRILPKHIWKPLCEEGDPTTFAPDPNLIASGPWRLAEYVPNSHILLVRNAPGSTVDTGLEGSTPITSPAGYFRQWPFNVYTHITEPAELADRNKIPYEANVTIVSDVMNYFALYPLEGNATVEVTVDETTETVLTNQSFYIEPKGVISTLDLHVIPTCWMWWDSWVHYTDLPGPKAILTYKECYHIYVNQYIVVTWMDTPIWNLIGQDKEVVICVYYYFLVPDMPFLPQCTWIPVDVDGRIYSTLKEDITGSTWYDDCHYSDYPYKTQLPTPDYKVDIKDVALAARSFGAYPGHERWSTVADINGDYKVDIKDIAAIAKLFGWVGGC